MKMLNLLTLLEFVNEVFIKYMMVMMHKIW